MLGLDVPIETVEPAAAAAMFARALPVVALGMPATAQPGKPDATSAPAAIASIDRAVADVIDGVAAAIVTNPVAKNVLYQSGFADPGHTEYLAKLALDADRQAGLAGDDAVVRPSSRSCRSRSTCRSKTCRSA